MRQLYYILPFLFLLSTTAVFSQCDSHDLALGRPATVSSIESIAFPASFAVDADTTGSRWSSAFSDPQWIYVDLGQSFNLCSVTLYWETAYGTAFNIDVSNDATNWTTLASITGNTSQTNMISISGSGRYVRMYGITRATQYGYSLYAFKVYGVANSFPPTDIALNQSASATTSLSGFGPNYAFDGSNLTFWRSTNNATQVLAVDLGALYNVAAVNMLFDVNYGINYNIDISADSVNWTTVDSVQNNSAMNVFTNSPGLGRYVRFSGITATVGNGYAVGEMTVLGTAAVLPVKLAAFTATAETNQTVLLQWTTDIEVNNKQFNIQRSTDGSHYTNIGDVAGAGNSDLPIDYTWTDNSPVKGPNYYRLQQVDVNGNYVYSPVAVASIGGPSTNSLSVYPNPAADMINILNPTGTLIREIRVFNTSGVEISRLAPQSTGTVQLPVSSWSSGLYLIKVITDQGSQVLKVIR